MDCSVTTVVHDLKNTYDDKIMKNLKKTYVVIKFLWLIGGLLGTGTTLANVTTPTIPDDASMNMTLSRIINQLDAILPLINQAEREQQRALPTATPFQFERFRTADGNVHNGLRQDVMAMREAIINAMTHKPVEVGTIAPMALDYIDLPRTQQTIQNH